MLDLYCEADVERELLPENHQTELRLAVREPSFHPVIVQNRLNLTCERIVHLKAVLRAIEDEELREFLSKTEPEEVSESYVPCCGVFEDCPPPELPLNESSLCPLYDWKLDYSLLLQWCACC